MKVIWVIQNCSYHEFGSVYPFFFRTRKAARTYVRETYYNSYVGPQTFERYCRDNFLFEKLTAK